MIQFHPQNDYYIHNSCGVWLVPPSDPLLQALLSPLGRGEDKNLKTWSGVKTWRLGEAALELKNALGRMYDKMYGVTFGANWQWCFFFGWFFSHENWTVDDNGAYEVFKSYICKIGISCPASNLVSAENHFSPPGLYLYLQTVNFEG